MYNIGQFVGSFDLLLGRLKYKYTGTSSTSVEMSSPCNDEIDMVITSVGRRIRYLWAWRWFVYRQVSSISISPFSFLTQISISPFFFEQAISPLVLHYQRTVGVHTFLH
jgi:hypothetical protein